MKMKREGMRAIEKYIRKVKEMERERKATHSHIFTPYNINMI